MTASWPRVTIDHLKAETPTAIAMGPFGSRIRTENFVSHGVPVIRGNNLNSGRFLDEGFVYITEGKADELRSANAFSLDLVITHRGTLGQVGIIPSTARYPRYVISQSQLKVTIDPAKADPHFVFYYLRSPEGQHQLLSNASQTGVPAIASPSRAVRSIQVPCPPLAEQRAIVHILGTLDDKIELNRRMSETLEEVARALFKSWFVDFDPVRAKMEGRWKPGQTLPGLPAHLYDLFPDRLVDSKLGEIPEGWQVGSFSDVVDHIRDNLDPQALPHLEFRHFSIPAFDEGQWPRTQPGRAIKSQKSRVLPGTVLLSKLNPAIQRVWLVDVEGEDAAVCSTEFLVLQPKKPFGRAFVYCLARSSVFRQEMEGLVTGTSNSHQRVRAEDVLSLSLVIPPGPLAESFDGVAEPMLKRALVARRECPTLATLRDALLPKLISGELRVKDTEKFLERAIG